MEVRGGGAAGGGAAVEVRRWRAGWSAPGGGAPGGGAPGGGAGGAAAAGGGGGGVAGADPWENIKGTQYSPLCPTKSIVLCLQCQSSGWFAKISYIPCSRLLLRTQLAVDDGS